MFIKVSGTSFSRAVSTSGTSKITVNFTKIKDKCRVQIVDDIVVNRYIDITQTDNQDFNITVVLDGAINLINKNLEVILTILGDTLMINQAAFQYIAVREPEDPVTFRLSQDNFVSWDIGYLKSLVVDIRALQNLGKELGENNINVNIQNKTAVIRMSNTLYAKPLNLPDMKISADTCKALIKHLRGNIKMMNVESEHIIVFKDDISEVIMPYTACDKTIMNTYTTLDKSISKSVTTVDLNRFESIIDILCKAYKRTQVNLTFIDKGISIFVEGSKSKFATGQEGKSLCSIRLSITQLAMLNKILGDLSEVEVWKGSGKICLKQKSYNKVLILAGIVY